MIPSSRRLAESIEPHRLAHGIVRFKETGGGQSLINVRSVDSREEDSTSPGVRITSIRSYGSSAIRERERLVWLMRLFTLHRHSKHIQTYFSIGQVKAPWHGTSIACHLSGRCLFISFFDASDS